MTTQPIMHEAEELGQNRPYTKDEATGLTVLAIALGIWGACGGVLLGGCVAFLKQWPFGACVLVGASTGFILGSGFVLLKGAWEQIDGLRSWRKATSYVPIVPQEPQPEEPHGPILVNPYKGEPYLLTDGKPGLPGREEALRLTPPVVAEILRLSVEQNGGEWSRRKLTAMKVYGQKVSRGVYEELTAWLAKTGVLQQTRQGGFTLPPDVHEFDDLVRYFPNLPGLGGPGGDREGREWGSPGLPGQAGAGETLAERRRQRWIECEHNVEAYKRGAK